jgi:SnoaL-like polyketide cyclase
VNLAHVPFCFTNFGIRQPGGYAAVRYIVTAWRTAFPDLHVQIEEELAYGDRVVHRVLAHGTHDGKIAGHAATRNDLLMLSQLGLLPGVEPVSEAAWRTQLTPGCAPSD